MSRTDLRRFEVTRDGATMGHGVLFPRLNRVAYQPRRTVQIQNHPYEEFLRRMTRIKAAISWQD